ncbi:TIGR04222 domain-containing membrane protein [Micromonospora sp. NBC_01813]|uniref:TIGR04222 domain-containing membrane protein n=1 Tax=Micromonospora sp. NBC_01813 TaxID=2975988 RepID=UPI002DDBA9FA|nr:TIGR04222 domain-containing membrane protein [Micromonospora sp. NBC_01813]WSA09899.1 TIGR04222 domain-containing membrane protein [Micromonospora sp. NBC_01813]
MTSGDTWGIPGPTFLALYGIAALGLLIISIGYRLTMFAGNRDPRPGDLTGTQVAHLTGGAPLAINAALGGLRGAGVIDVGGGRALRASGPLPAGADELTAAVHYAAYQQRRVRDLAADPRIRQSLDRLQDHLEHAGLAASRARRVTARWLGAALLGLAGVGVLRLIAGLANGRPVGYLVLLLALTVPVGLLLTIAVPRVTRSGRRALGELRRSHRHLSPSSRPAYATYGMTGAVMGVALFGSAALWTMDPDFAEAASIQRVAANGSGGGAAGDSGGSGGGGDGGGGGCGGGGCGG